MFGKKLLHCCWKLQHIKDKLGQQEIKVFKTARLKKKRCKANLTFFNMLTKGKALRNSTQNVCNLFNGQWELVEMYVQDLHHKVTNLAHREKD